MSDRIFLRGLSAKCIIGFIDWERRTPQTLLIDLEIPCDCARAARSDRVEDTVDYKRVAKRVLGWLPTTQFQLVESLAHHLALLLVSEFSLDWVRVSVNKPGAIRDSRDVGIQLERRREDLAGWQLPATADAGSAAPGGE
ncbi:MAG TPA: dihydroneopterin aldolase [Steroidobacteraceae bacterium]|jgi:dihydroneopterin aldolase|nr:dihydroneopterin aldolase [Steroidobacteraceae bacterium]